MSDQSEENKKMAREFEKEANALFEKYGQNQHIIISSSDDTDLIMSSISKDPKKVTALICAVLESGNHDIVKNNILLNLGRPYAKGNIAEEADLVKFSNDYQDLFRNSFATATFNATFIEGKLSAALIGDSKVLINAICTVLLKEDNRNLAEGVNSILTSMLKAFQTVN